MSRTPALRDHIATLILDKATALFATHGESVSMADIAAAADIGRATLYRYFASRDALLEAMATAALTELRQRLTEARLETVPAPEALARLTRIFLAVGGKYVVLTRTGAKPADRAEIAATVTEPVQAVITRGIDAGDLRADLPADALLLLYGSLIETGIPMAAGPGGGVEHAAALIVDMFLHGAGGH
ncbi:TetR/AcrR family transcriptional regulator [Nocardia concava]|uniref:TetR/AcrR family transcriptional regulator n=1 Tax=Nocardia concava TaxID=257281 RepID=UPI0002D9CF6B|nr:TetR/AcrR family transcriptional regulator [Nocardia concava]